MQSLKTWQILFYKELMEPQTNHCELCKSKKPNYDWHLASNMTRWLIHLCQGLYVYVWRPDQKKDKGTMQYIHAIWEKLEDIYYMVRMLHLWSIHISYGYRIHYPLIILWWLHTVAEFKHKNIQIEKGVKFKTDLIKLRTPKSGSR